jgi:hypothetical protein
VIQAVLPMNSSTGPPKTAVRQFSKVGEKNHLGGKAMASFSVFSEVSTIHKMGKNMAKATGRVPTAQTSVPSRLRFTTSPS